MKKIYLFAALFAAFSVNAQVAPDSLLVNEDFDYEVGAALVSNPVASEDNLDSITGWSTQANKTATINGFTVVEGNLTYPNYPGGQRGNMLRHEAAASGQTQAVIKRFTHHVKNDTTLYIAFLLKFDNTDATGSWFCGIKIQDNPGGTNWGAPLYAKVQTEYPGEEISFGIKKNTNAAGTWVDPNNGPFYAANQTLLVVIKYHVGKLYGENNDDEAGHFDDVMELFINPDPTKPEPAATLHHEDATEKDIYRWAAPSATTPYSTPFGSAYSFILRGDAAGSFPDYYMDGIRAAITWEGVMGTSQPSAIESVSQKENENQVQKMIVDGKIVIVKNGVRYSILGTRL